MGCIGYPAPIHGFGQPAAKENTLSHKIVHIVPTRPDPQGTGADLRNTALHQGLAALGDVVLVAVDDFLPQGSAIVPCKRSVIEADLPACTVKSVVAQVQALAPALIVLEGVALADIAYGLMAVGQGYVLDMHNVESDLRRQMDRAKRGRWAPIRYRRRWQDASRAEAAVIRGALRVIGCSDQDGQRAMALAGRDIVFHVVPNPVPGWCQDRVLPVMTAPAQNRILFVGHLGYAPNIIAAKRLLTRIFPAIRLAAPDAALDICGRMPQPKLRALAAATPKATLHADPVDLAPHYAAASVAVIPLTEGGGTRLKVLEALAVGLPIVASAKAVEGIGLVPGHHYLMAETDAQYVDAALQVMRDAGLAARLAGNGKAWVQDRFSAAAIGRAVAAALASLLDSAGHDAPALDAALPAKDSRPG
ncbi:glycosyl transferases group 1 [Yoonia vestfoldensis]|uniref:Glycosyl transferases group 1 n=1 Tax=Yoonia vestfoldensis TaxID=245188 RepID=A0A1Y0ECG5_9RHOB|nr:glycosyl transferases group 1 [Yoonia vestfoldensis]